MTREDSEGIRRVEALLRQNAENEKSWREKHQYDIESLRSEMRAGFEKQDRRLGEVEEKMAQRGGMAKAAGWIIAMVVALGATVGAFFRGWTP